MTLCAARLVLVASFASCLAAVAQEQVPVSAKEPTGFVDKTIAVGGTEHRYAVYVPPDYTRERVWPLWPLIVFLHGMGECGTDGKRHLDVGLGPAIRAEPDRWPFVVVFPQKPDRHSQWAEHEPMVMAMLAATEREYRIDPSRRLLTGLSQGGAGTWALGAAHANLWAALAPICGYGDPAEIAPKLTSMPILAFHGLDDPIVPPRRSKDLVDAVKAGGGSVVLTEYSGVGHNSWDKAYRESALAECLRMFPWWSQEAFVLADPDGERRMGVALAIQQGRRTQDTSRIEVTTTSIWPGGRWHRRSGLAGEEPRSVTSGALEPREGRELLVESMRTLVRGGVLDLVLERQSGRRVDPLVEPKFDDPRAHPHVGLELEPASYGGGRTHSCYLRLDDAVHSRAVDALQQVARRFASVAK